MTSRTRLTRSTGLETPMDFEFTSRPSSFSKPVWAAGEDDPSTPRKRPYQDANPPAPAFPAPPQTPSQPSFGTKSNIPFLFQEPPPQISHPPAWVPPPHLSQEKAVPQPELKDVDMAEQSPPKPLHTLPEKGGDTENEGDRPIARGAMLRVFRKRQRGKERSRLRRAKSEEHDGVDSDSDDDSEGEGRITPINQTMSNHYTLNMPGPASPPSDLPYVLLGYLQFFFNLSLILVFLYLLVQFILTVQRDVELRISEYSMDIVQEIAQCALQYKTNLCVTNPIPAMVHQCAVWETCMNRDPSKIGRAKVGAELIAEVVNGFVEPISWKTLIFTLTSLAFLTAFVNALLSLYRSKINPATHGQHMHHPPAIPSFPMASPSPYPGQHYLPPSEWAKPWQAAQDDVAQAPSRRRKLEGGDAEKIM